MAVAAIYMDPVHSKYVENTARYIAVHWRYGQFLKKMVQFIDTLVSFAHSFFLRAYFERLFAL